MSTMQRIIRSNQMAGSNAVDAGARTWLYAESGRLSAAYIDNVVAITADNTNYITVTATMNGETVFTRTTEVANGNLVANADELQTLLISGLDLDISTGDTITFAVAEAGTGPAYDLSVALVFDLVN